MARNSAGQAAWAARGAVAAAWFVVLTTCANGVKVPDSTCAVSADCQAYASCALSPEACTCQGGACYYDSSRPPPTTAGCRGCHGGLENAAPPLDVDGGREVSRLGVGAHQTHLVGGASSRPVPCNTCHLVPTTVDQPGHRDDDLPAELVWSGLAAPRNALTSTWNRTSATCFTYCHGVSLSGGSNVTPAWTIVNGTQAACGTCHGVPPAGDHPQATTCEQCHAPTAGPGQTIANPMTHVDGVLQVVSGSCTSCHGTGSDPAPPRGVQGETATTTVAVGAHQAHLRDGALRLAMGCPDCHVLPSSSEQPGHLDPPTITWGPLARSGGATPTWNGTAATCANTWCHGNFSGGNRSNTPVWTRVDGQQARCGTCHGNPPPSPHPRSTACASCHPETVTPAGTIDTTGGRHINGAIEGSSQACNTCHGNSTTGAAAPPLGTQGETSTTSRAVGAHEAHLDPTPTWRRTVACRDCHPVPTVGTHSDSVVQVQLTGLARGDGGLNASYGSAAMTCANVYCHGASLRPARDGGVVRRVPVWTQVDGTFSDCGTSCHTNPPGLPHPQAGQCATCHDAVIDQAGTIIAPDLHINGLVNVRAVACNSCHGGPANNAPPVSSTGSSTTTDPAVGAHQRHVRASTVAQPFECDECHRTPGVVTDPGHLDSSANAEVVFGALATTGGTAPSWVRTVGSCGNTYCHGATLDGGTNRSPAWTTVTGSPLGCTACHGNPPPLPHVQNSNCFNCHDQTVTDGGAVNVDAGFHLNGTLDVSGASCKDCHGTPGVPNDAPPLGTHGETATSSPAVGAHQPHLLPSPWHRTLRCNECHVVPVSPNHENRLVDFAFAGGASYNSAARTCSNVACHGAALAPSVDGGSNLRVPLWTQVDGTYDRCGTACHSNPPGGTHVRSTQCAACHPSVINASGTITNPALHVNGVVESTTPNCNACHGGTANSAPPVSTTGATSTSNVGVGAHQRHLTGGAIRRGMPCTECHAVPATPDSAGHLDPSPAELTFGALARSGGATPTWARTSATCANTYCHGATLAGGTLTQPVWTTVNGTQAACGTCHGHPPPLPHAQFTQCRNCHPATITTAETINLDGGHINGSVEHVPVHPPHAIWNTPDSGNFHGDEANTGLAPCQACHGATLTGGPANVSCASAACHPGWTTDCDFCHGGTDNTSGAPPKDLRNSTAPSSVTVGTHTSHLSARHAISSTTACAACHLVPADVFSPGHIDPGPAELRFGQLATTGGAVVTWNRGAATCTGSYCHGNFDGGVNAAAGWTNTTGAEVACTRCHPSRPTTGDHGRHRSEGCDECHNTIVNAGGTAIVTPPLHINGVEDVRLRQGGTWTASTRRCTPSCHGAETW